MNAVMVDPGSLVAGATLLLPRSESHHLRVRRVALDARLRVLDGHGASAEGVWLGDGRVAIESVDRTPRPAALALAVGVGDRERFGWVVEKAAELGVGDVIPLETDHTAGVSNRVRSGHVERLQRRAFEGIKQSGAVWAPVVHLPHSVEELVARYASGNRWLADPAGAHPDTLGEPPDLVVVGPEGGLTPAERMLLLESNFQPVRLGAFVLRFETAAIAAAAVAFQRRELSRNV